MCSHKHTRDQNIVNDDSMHAVFLCLCLPCTSVNSLFANLLLLLFCLSLFLCPSSNTQDLLRLPRLPGPQDLLVHRTRRLGLQVLRLQESQEGKRGWMMTEREREGRHALTYERCCTNCTNCRRHRIYILLFRLPVLLSLTCFSCVPFPLSLSAAEKKYCPHIKTHGTHVFLNFVQLKKTVGGDESRASHRSGFRGVSQDVRRQ